MAQAKINNIIPDPTRRRFLAVAGIASAVSAGALATAAAMTAPQACPTFAQGIPDPIYAAIASHKSARAAVLSLIEVSTGLQEELPRDKRRSSVDAREENIVASDDPRWIDCERAVMRAWQAEEDTAIDMVCIQPTTRAGFLALLEHAVAYDTDGEGWPRGLQSDDGKRTRDWHQFLIENLVAGKAALCARPGC
jgi:hypothetical protein